MKNILKKIFNIKQKKVLKYSFGNDIPLDWIINNNEIKYQKRISIVIPFIYFLFLIIITRLFYLSFNFGGNKNQNLINKNKTVISRPNILDRNGELLATSLIAWDLYVEPHRIVNPELSAQELVKIIPTLKYEDVLKKITSKKKFDYIARKILPLQKEKIILIGEPGFGFFETQSRVYPYNNIFSHIIGTTNLDNKGMSGIEKYIDQNKLLNSDKSIELSVDAYIQDAIWKNLSAAMNEYNAKSAGGIIMDVKTGEILGMVSLPDFHNNDYRKILLNPLYNNHVSFDVYEVGSVMKIFNTALALENNYPNDKFFEVLKPLKIGDHLIKDSHPKKALLNMKEGFIYSSNIVMANIAKDLGIAKQKEFFSKLNLVNKINFELPESGTPLLPKKWDEFDSVSIGYGYSISPTLLNVVAAVNGIVNDGLYIEPTIIKRNKDSLLKYYQVVNSNTSSIMKKFMQLVITKGTGYMANLKNIKVGGKTGTSYKLINGKYDNQKIRTFFLSIFPADDPKYTMLIMLDEAKNNGCTSSSCTAVPVSAKIIDDITPILNLDLKINR